MLVGRRAEQQAIDRLIASARLGTSGVLALTGEAGVGKTALLQDAVDGLSGMRLLRATGLETERDIPFGSLLQLVRPALGALEGIPPIQAEALAAALALPSAAPAAGGRDAFAVGAAVLSLICRHAEDGPVAVVVDDLHLTDTPSVNALVFAARRLGADPVVVLVAARSPDGDQVVAGLPSMIVPGLDIASARALVDRALPEPVSDEHLTRLHSATHGNPLALLELGAADADVVASVETGMPLRVPRALADAFGRRLARVDAGCRAALLVAAVCGPDLRLITDACTVLGVDVSRLGDAEDDGLITAQAGVVQFRHPLLRSAVYSGASVQDRRAAHGAAADALPPAEIDRRAWHLSESVWHPDAGVADLLAEAAEHAGAKGAYSVASSAFERSARMSPDRGARAARLLRAADTAWTAGMRDRALALLDEHARQSGPAVDGVVAAGGLRELELRATIAARSGSVRDALLVLLSATERTDLNDDAVVLLADAVHACYYLGDARTAVMLSDRLALRLPDVNDGRARALGLMATGIAKILAGRGGVDDIRAAVPLLETDPQLRHDPRRLSWLLLAPLFLRDSTGGIRLRALVDEVRGAAGIGALPAVLFHVARDEATTSAWTRAEADYTESIRLATDTGQTTELAMSLAGLSWLESRAGKSEACRVHAVQARELCRARDIHMGEVWADFALGDLELSLGRPQRAIEHLRALTELLDRLGLDDADLSPAPELAAALLRLGRRDEARDVVAAFRDHATSKGQPWARARADRACGEVAPDTEIDTWFEAALDWHSRTLDRFETARTRLAFGQRLRRSGRRVDARMQLRGALGEFADLGAAVWRDRAAAELTATGEHVSMGTGNAIVDLTPQELQVSLLLADGRTTREAAAALFLSPKTVEYHLRKVYTKLGISSRAELAAMLPGDPGTA